ncbi:hypothetical protein [Streptomyces sp. NPDC055506]
MPATAVLRQPSRTLVITATAVPLALAVLADLLAYSDRLLRTGRSDRV